jgi:PAS domain S-box-containing protein
MPSNPLRILLIEDDANDSLIIRGLLDQIAPQSIGHDSIDARWVRTPAAAYEARSTGFVVALIGYRVGATSGVELLRDLKAQGWDGAAIMLTSKGDREADVAAMHAGASDFLIKDGLDATTLERSIRHVLERRRREAEIRFHSTLLDAVGQAVIATDMEGRVIYWNSAAQRIYGYTADEMVGAPADRLVPEDMEDYAAVIIERVRAGESWSGEFTLRRKDGTLIQALVTDAVIRDARGDIIGIIGVSTDVSASKRVEERLRKSETLLAESQRIAQVGSFEWDVATNTLTCSDEWCRLFGFPDGSTVSVDQMWERVHPDDREHMVRITEEALRSGTHCEYDFRIVGLHGGTRIIHLRAGVVRDRQGRPLRVIGTDRDVTERHAAEIALRESEERYRGLVELAPDGIVVRCGESIVFANEAAARLFGASNPEELVGVSAVNLTHADFRSALLKRIGVQNVPATRMSAVEERLLRLDGTEFEAEISSIVTTYRGQPAVQSIVRDITSRKATDAALRRQALVYETISEAVIIADMNASIVDCNSGAERLFGFSKAEMLGQSPALFHGPGSREVFDEMTAALQRHGRWAGEVRFVTKQGVERIGDLVIVAQRDGNGGPIATVGVTRDITDRKRAEEALRRSEERLHLSQRLEAVGQLAGGVAHDFNNLLTAITSYTHLLLEDMPLDDQRREDLHEIKKAADRATSLTRQLLAFSRKQVLDPKVLDVNMVVAELEKMLRRLIGEHIALVTDYLQNIPRVHVDVGQLEQVIVNLAVNARDAMPDGGTLSIRTAAVELTEEHWLGHADVEARPGHYVALIVSDTGIGMDRATRERIFEPFFTTKGPGKGTGLGLATVYGIVKQSGGFIWVYSEPGQGSTFKIYLPAVAAPVPYAGDSSSGVPEMPNGSGTILIVEDEAAVRSLARRVLEQVGYTVLEASDGLEGARVAEEYDGDIDLLLTDVVMPNLGGRALVGRLHRQRPEMAVLFISGYPEGEVALRSLTGDAASYLEKPFSPQVLRDAVRLALEGEHA